MYNCTLNKSNLNCRPDELFYSLFLSLVVDDGIQYFC